MKFTQNNKPHPYFQGGKNTGTSSTSEKKTFFCLQIEIQVVAHSQDQGKEFPEIASFMVKIAGISSLLSLIFSPKIKKTSI